MLRWLALFPLVAFALSCVTPVRVDASAASRRRTIAVARTGHAPPHALSSAGKEPRIRFNAPTPRDLGLFHGEDVFTLGEPALFGMATCDPGTRCRLVDHRALIRRLCRTQHRPPAAAIDA